MIKKCIGLLILVGISVALMAQTPQVEVYKPIIPILTGRCDNVVYEVTVKSEKGGDVLDAITLLLPDHPYVASAQLFYSGGTSVLRDKTRSQAIKKYFGELSGGQRIFFHPKYSIKKGEVHSISNEITLTAGQGLVKGDNYFWIGFELKPEVPLTAMIRSQVKSVRLNGQNFPGSEEYSSRVGVPVRNSGDDGVYAYRIPGLVTTKKGSLLAVYDARYHTAYDLQEDVDVALSRSVDGGRTWEPMRVIMDMGEWGGLPQSQNGIGDPSILVDEVTGRIWCAALWTHGMGNSRAWQASQPGMNPEEETGQVILVYSDDDGKTWSKPQNITPQIKDPSWRLILQGPGRGTCMQDGTLVFPIQYVDSLAMPHASIIWSKDRGDTWKIGTPPQENTTESQVIQLQDGSLMLNMRDNKGKSRAIYTTWDLGETWREHSSSRSALQEPVCMASLIKTTYKGKEVLLFCNPNSTETRKDITIKVSLDGGLTWKEKNQVLLDDQPCWGYSCLTVVTPGVIGVLYEGSTAQMVFHALNLPELINN